VRWSLGVCKTHTRAGRPPTNGNVEALQRTILDECWRPAFARSLYVRFTDVRRELDTYLHFQRRPLLPWSTDARAASPLISPTVRAQRWRRDEQELSANFEDGPY
jgi:hypothetical protein